MIPSKSFFYGALIGSSTYAVLKWFHDKIYENKRGGRVDCLLFLPTLGSLRCLKEGSEGCGLEFCGFCNFKKMNDILKETKRSLDVCMYLITLKELSNLIIELFHRGVFVRIIIDKQMSLEAHNAKVFPFLKEYIPIRVIDAGEIMHNKFVIIDQKKLITGSFNWTKQGMLHNFENGIVVSDTKIVKKYQNYFQTLWDLPINN